jgi:hypothetical protein
MPLGNDQPVFTIFMTHKDNKWTIRYCQELRELF